MMLIFPHFPVRWCPNMWRFGRPEVKSTSLTTSEKSHPQPRWVIRRVIDNSLQNTHSGRRHIFGIGFDLTGGRNSDILTVWVRIHGPHHLWRYQSTTASGNTACYGSYTWERSLLASTYVFSKLLHQPWPKKVSSQVLVTFHLPPRLFTTPTSNFNTRSTHLSSDRQQEQTHQRRWP